MLTLLRKNASTLLLTALLMGITYGLTPTSASAKCCTRVQAQCSYNVTFTSCGYCRDCATDYCYYESGPCFWPPYESGSGWSMICNGTCDQ